MKLYLGESIRKFRSKNNITQEKLAAHLGVSYQAVSRWENETSYPDIELLPEIASFFGVNLEELLGIKDNTKKADDKSRELYNRVLDNCLPKGEIIKILDELRDLERKYPNNWEIKTRICEILLFYSNRSTDEILPEIRR